MPTIDPDAIFRPTQELDFDTAALFAGRQDILLTAANHLARPESCVAIYGERGVGKSSIARILMGLLDGHIDPATLGITLTRPLPRRVCVRASWGLGIHSLEHLFYTLFDPDLEEERSFAQLFPQVAEKIRKKFERIDLTALKAEGEEAGEKKTSLGPNQTLVHDMLRTVQDAVIAAGKRGEEPAKHGLVIVLDEMELAPPTAPGFGLGTLIKGSKFQFILVGIGEDIKHILSDHQSALRKFGGQFPIPPLSPIEVRELFDNASKQAAEQEATLKFADDFCELVAEDFSGYPAQIQAFGLDVVLAYQQQLEGGAAVTFRGKDYVTLLSLRETSPHRDITALTAFNAGVGDSVNRWEAVKVIVQLKEQENARWVFLPRLRRKLPAQFQVKLPEHLRAMVTAGVLKASDENAESVSIASPAVLCEIKRRMRQNWEPKSRLTAKDPPPKPPRRRRSGE